MTTDNNIDYLLQHLTSLLTRNSDQILQEQLGVGYAQFKIMRITENGHPVKQRYIADVLGQTEASVSRQTKILIKKGYVTKKVDPHNKRVRLVEITQKGQEMTSVILDLLNKYHKSIMGNISDKQQASLISMLEILHNQMCSFNHSPKANYLDLIGEK